MDCPSDRAAGDLGNIVALEHVNVTVPDRQIATLFYVVVLGNRPQHPLCMRPLAIHNPGQSNLNYARGHDEFLWATPTD
jgi:hypothetical protein